MRSVGPVPRDHLPGKPHDGRHRVRDTGFLTVRRDSLRVPLRGSLTVRVVPGSGHFTGNLVLRPAAVGHKVLGVSLFGATVRIDAESPVTGRIDEQGQMSATVNVDAVLTAVRLGGWTLTGGDSCRTATHAVVPLHSRPSFDLARRPPGRPVPAAAVHRVRMADSGHQPAGGRPGERCGHRPHPEYITPRMPGPEVSGGRDDWPKPTGSAWLTFWSGARRMDCRGGWRQHGGTRTSWAG